MAKGLKPSNNPLFNFEENSNKEQLEEIVPIASNVENLTLNQMVQETLQKINEAIILEKYPKKFTCNPKKLKHSDIFTGATLAIRRDYLELIERIWKNSVIDKYEVLDMIIKKGLESIDFDE